MRYGILTNANASSKGKDLVCAFYNYAKACE